MTSSGIANKLGKRKLEPGAHVGYLPIIEKIAHLFARPDARLRFISGVLTHADTYQSRLQHAFRHAPFLTRTGFYRWLLTLGVRQGIASMAAGDTNLSAGERTLLLAECKLSWFDRRVLAFASHHNLLYTSAIAVVGFGVVCLLSTAFVIFSRVSHLFVVPPPVQATSVAGTRTAQTLPTVPQSQEVWLVEKTDEFERYSNGLRVVTKYQTDGRPRSYQILTRDLIAKDESVHTEPTGILYHSSESRLLPFHSQNNESITNISIYLLEYIRKNKSYNYVIDRFGQVYRIIPDSQVANHAGRSVWADARGTFIELNESFIGVCFETSSVDPQVDGDLTEAQLISGRLLTGTLRSLHKIDDANCTTHGLASISPENMQIAFHTDWLAGFPFQAMGLSDKSSVPLFSISELGFEVDESTLKLIGGRPLPGMQLAQTEFNLHVAQSGLPLAEYRKRRRDDYVRIQNRIRAGHEDTLLPERKS